ncbi:MAG: radical SAM protein [Desulfobulbaceae bacterium]|nr:radical SAM protein [Desulfobulbaceae bacterium]
MCKICNPNQQPGCGCKAPEWITLPIAPHAAARSRFCGEENLPQAVPLHGALTWVDDLLKRGVSVTGLDINGPGDPLATLPMTLELLDRLRERHPGFLLGVTTLGLGLADHASPLAQHGVARVTLLVDAVRPEIVQKLYVWIRPGKRNMPMAEAAAILIDEQSKGISACRSAGIEVTVLCTVYLGVNEQEVEEIARHAAALGAEGMALLPGKGWLGSEEKLTPPAPETMERLRGVAARHIKLVTRPEAEDVGAMKSATSCAGIPSPTVSRPNVAVLSSNGMDIDLHLGQAIKALIYGPREDGLACLLGTRTLPEPGGGESRWQQVAETLHDCFVLLATSAGQKPREILGQHGLTLLFSDDNVEGTVDVLFGGGKKGKCKK